MTQCVPGENTFKISNKGDFKLQWGDLALIKLGITAGSAAHIYLFIPRLWSSVKTAWWVQVAAHGWKQTRACSRLPYADNLCVAIKWKVRFGVWAVPRCRRSSCSDPVGLFVCLSILMPLRSLGLLLCYFWNEKTFHTGTHEKEATRPLPGSVDGGPNWKWQQTGGGIDQLFLRLVVCWITTRCAVLTSAMLFWNISILKYFI